MAKLGAEYLSPVRERTGDEQQKRTGTFTTFKDLYIVNKKMKTISRTKIELVRRVDSNRSILHCKNLAWSPCDEKKNWCKPYRTRRVSFFF